MWDSQNSSTPRVDELEYIRYLLSIGIAAQEALYSVYDTCAQAGHVRRSHQNSELERILT
jgi:hypothetical protein